MLFSEEMLFTPSKLSLLDERVIEVIVESVSILSTELLFIFQIEKSGYVINEVQPSK